MYNTIPTTSCASALSEWKLVSATIVTENCFDFTETINCDVDKVFASMVVTQQNDTPAQAIEVMLPTSTHPDIIDCEIL